MSGTPHMSNPPHDIAVGLESKDDDTSVPKTDAGYIREHDGSSWSCRTYNDVEDDAGEGFITQCTRPMGASRSA